MSESKSIDERIDEQLDRLESPHLSEAEIEAVEKRIAFLKSMK